MHERRDFIEILIEDHAAAEATFADLADLLNAPRTAQTEARMQELTRHVITELVKHAVAEEEYLYPRVRSALADGDAIADREIVEHAKAEETMKTLERLSPANLDYRDTVFTLAAQIREHAGEEEAELLPALGAALSPEERLQLGAELEKAKAAAPTHPHPPAAVALVDRLRDKLSSRKG
jgi:hemerythrin superfamily protein